MEEDTTFGHELEVPQARRSDEDNSFFEEFISIGRWGAAGAGAGLLMTVLADGSIVQDIIGMTLGGVVGTTYRTAQLQDGFSPGGGALYGAMGGVFLYNLMSAMVGPEATFTLAQRTHDFFFCGGLGAAAGVGIQTIHYVNDRLEERLYRGTDLQD